jgi:glycine dehydrogenase subunit 1
MADGAHPFVPNSAPAARTDMLARIGVAEAEALYASIPERLRVHGPLDLPEALASEQELERHLDDLLAHDLRPEDLLSFLGGGCALHHVPALCEEIVGRAEFLTAYWANAYTDHGKYQAFFEFASLLGELLELDAVAQPTYDWGMAAGVSLRMACRVTGRSRVLVADAIGRERAAIVRTYLAPDVELTPLPTLPGTATLDLDALEAALAGDVAAAYFESPTYLGAIETATAEATALLHERGALAVVGVDPLSLGVLASPASAGADIVCGDLQPLGIPLLYGGGLSGFVATRDEERFVREFPMFLIGRTDTSVPGEHGFGLVAHGRTSYMLREQGKDFGGTTTGLWGIAAAVYLSLLGPAGLRELGEGIMQRRVYAARRLAAIPGVTVPAADAPRFKEFPVSFAGTGLSVAEVNRRLLREGILGGHAIDAPGLDAAALYCVTEAHRQADIDRLADAIAEAVRP